MNISSSSFIIFVILLFSSCLFINSQIPHCLTYNATNGGCITCEVPYKVSIGSCQLTVPSKYCTSFNYDLQCLICNIGYYLFLNKNYYDCRSKTFNCLVYNNASYSCQTCVSGYVLNGTQGYCIVANISNCYYQVETTCYSCNDGYNLTNNQCSYYIQNCAAVNQTSCLSCITGYSLASNNTCNLTPIPSIITPVFYDPFCKDFDNLTSNTCIQCSSGYYFNTLHLCTQVDPSCKTYNTTNGDCLTCFLGYTVINNTCLQDKDGLSLMIDPNCNTYDFQKKICTKCSQGSVLNAQGKCVNFGDNNCQTPTSDLSACLTCYKGYYYNSTQKKCKLANYNCLDWNNNGTCLSCSVGYYIDQFLNCALIDPACKSFNLNAKKCISCYLGYALDETLKCVQLSQLPISTKKYYDNCSQFDQSNKCLSCYWGYFIQTDSKGPYCAQVSPYCRTYNSINGKCTSCYFGYYQTSNGTCVRFM